MAIKSIKQTVPVPNPLHNYASYTYSWSLWWLDAWDYNQLMKSKDVDSALTFTPGTRSFVVAEDGGVFPKQRQPGTRGLNYHIQDVQFETVIGPNKVSRSSNMINGSMKIIEPYGVTFIDTLIEASFTGTKYINYTDQPYMLQLNFTGYDDAGNEIAKTSTFTKRFPIRIQTMKVSVTSKGTEYHITYVPYGHQASFSEHKDIPKNFTITAKTVDDFFNGEHGLSAQMRDYYKTEMLQGRANFGDGFYFRMDKQIADSSIVDNKSVSLAQANPSSKTIDLTHSTFSIPRGTPIIDIITKVLSHSDYIIKLQLKLGESTEKKQTDIFNAFKTLTSVEISGIDYSGEVHDGVFDVRRNIRPKIITYKIHQYPIFDASHPQLNHFTDSIPYTSKIYNYLYTGKNTDVIDFKIDFDTTYHQSILAFTNAVAAETSTENTDIDRKNATDTLAQNKNKIILNPAVFSASAPILGLIKSVGQLRYRTVVGDQNITNGMNTISRPDAQVAADVINSIYTSLNGDMLRVPMTIVGDPTLIKQDDWLYVPDPIDAANYNSWDSVSQADFMRKYGHARMDTGEVIVTVNINSPVDLDTDIEGYNAGLSFPQANSTRSLFSGQYKINKITNKFSNGKFEQVLELYRYKTGDYTTAFNQLENSARSSDADAQEGGFYGSGTGVSTGTSNDLTLSATNSSPASEQKTGPLTPGDTIVLNPNSTTPWVVEVNGDPRQ